MDTPRPSPRTNRTRRVPSPYRFLSQPSVIQEIINFDAKVVTKDVRDAVKQLLVSKAASFQAENIARVSQAAAPMAAWVKAQMQYSLVLERIKPLTDELTRLDKSLAEATARKERCEEDIRASDEVPPPPLPSY